jgi:phthalate 4,5-dioxygenase
MRECNWLQALEGDIDTVHAAFLHRGMNEPEDYPEGTFTYYELKNRAARYVALDKEFGAMYGGYRPAEPGENYWRIGQFLFPFWSQVPSGLLGHKISVNCYVPMDDHHTMVFQVNSVARSAFGKETLALTRSLEGSDFYQPNTTDWFGRFRMVQSAENDYLMNREDQVAGVCFTGIPGNALPEDTAVTESMGPIMDRTSEHLGTSDVMIIRVRRRLLQAIKAFSDEKEVPPGVDNPSCYAIRSGSVVLPEDTDWLEGVKDLLPAFVDNNLNDEIVGPAGWHRPK